MSASAWSMCPRCQTPPCMDQEAFREDYEIYGADEGVVVVDYSGHCRDCDLGIDFKTKHPFYQPPVGSASAG